MPSISGWRECFQLAMLPAVRHRALKTAALIGTLLALINHGSELVAGSMSSVHWLRVGLTYLVPYGVATWSSVQTLRHIPDPHAPD